MPARSKLCGLVLAPGASASRDQAGLVELDQAIGAIGVEVERIDFPYRLAGRRAPDRPPVLIEAITEASSALASRLGVAQSRIALGGRSMGGRIASMAVAEGLSAGALVLVSYPLHPPGRPDRLRVEHFPQITVPCLFVSGSRDAFGTPEELEAAVAAIPAAVSLVVLYRGDHGLARRASEVATIAADWIRAQR